MNPVATLPREQDVHRGSSIFAELTGTALTAAIIMAAGAITGLLSARVLGPVGRGELTAVTIWAQTILYAGSLGLGEATAYFAGHRSHEQDAVFVTAQVLALCVGTVVLAAGWLALPVVLARHSADVQGQARTYLLFFLLPGISSMCASAWLQGSGRVAALNVVRATVHVVTAASMATFAVFGLASVRSFLAATLLGNTVTWLAGLWAWRSARGSSANLRRALVRPMLLYGSKVQFGTWSAAANVRLDQLMLSSFAASASLGLYVVGVSYAGLVLTVPAVAGIVMLPRLIRDCAAGTGGVTLTAWYRRVFWSTAAAGTCLWAMAGIAVPRLFGDGFADSVTLQTWLIPGACVLGMNQLLATGFRGHGLPGVASRAEIVGLMVTIPLLAALLPRYGIYGAAVTSVCAYSMVSLYLLSKARRIVPSVWALWWPTGEDWIVARHAGRLVLSSIVGVTRTLGGRVML